MMKINKDKSIGRVLFIVEGSKTEFSLLRRIFCNILGYEYIEKRRNRADFFQNKNKSSSKVAVINTEQSNISDILDENDYLDDIFATLVTEYNFPIDRSAIYYLFDRDPISNVDINLIEKLLNDLKNPYENEDLRGGLLLLSYPSVEAYIVSSFNEDTHNIEFSLGSDVKAYIASNNHMQLNKLSENTIEKAAYELIKYIEGQGIKMDIDYFGETNSEIFYKQEEYFKIHSKYKLISLLSVAFIQLGIIEIEK
ncbi:hypothetical protein [Defluviitalea phaphyphila]|uniref:hypothetical protein n=1 Tax=Defluviitalea phaphyphila TaxID=1473580 RepID=UPI001FA7D197|nr:hypothetical protein [Defluviitalea phaphyphila]